MRDSDCVAFLQWALPRLDLQWAGFRKVRRQVCKRLKRRISALGLEGFAAYRRRLECDPEEWRMVDECCRITISRFFRDRGIFEAIRTRVLPAIAARAEQEERDIRCWSAGCAAGEEPYTLKILWDLELSSAFPHVPFTIVATDIDAVLLARARKACFPASSLHDLPPQFIAEAFDRVGTLFCLRARHRENVTFLQQDLRREAPAGPFDLVLCRYLAFTYFSLSLQREVLVRILERLAAGGYLVIGTHEALPQPCTSLTPLCDTPYIFIKERGGAANRPVEASSALTPDDHQAG